MESKACVSCRLGEVEQGLCGLCGAKFCDECSKPVSPAGNIPEANCSCRPMGWHTPGAVNAKSLNEQLPSNRTLLVEKK